MKIVIFLLLALFSCAVLPAQNDIPIELDIYPESIKIESEYLTYFYPLGFSERDSYFAYVLYENASGGIGYYTYFELNIQNIVTDEVELQLIYDGRYRIDPNKGTYPELYKIDPEDGYLEFEVVWRHVLEDVHKALNDFGIVRNRNHKLMPFPYVDDDGTSYTVNIETAGNIYDNFRLDSYYVEFIRSEAEKKTIFSDQDCEAIAVAAVGLIESPYERRVVVILRETVHGFEGPPNYYSPVIVGSHLEYGF